MAGVRLRGSPSSVIMKACVAGKLHGECRAYFGSAFHSDGAPVGLYHLPCNPEPEPEAAVVASLDRSFVAIEDSRLRRGADSDAVVANGENGNLVSAGHRDIDGLALAVFDGV